MGKLLNSLIALLPFNTPIKAEINTLKGLLPLNGHEPTKYLVLGLH